MSKDGRGTKSHNETEFPGEKPLDAVTIPKGALGEIGKGSDNGSGDFVSSDVKPSSPHVFSSSPPSSPSAAGTTPAPAFLTPPKVGSSVPSQNAPPRTIARLRGHEDLLSSTGDSELEANDDEASWMHRSSLSARRYQDDEHHRRRRRKTQQKLRSDYIQRIFGDSKRGHGNRSKSVFKSFHQKQPSSTRSNSNTWHPGDLQRRYRSLLEGRARSKMRKEKMKQERERLLAKLTAEWKELLPVLPDWNNGGRAHIEKAIFKRMSTLATLGIPSRLRQTVWPVSIGNRLSITADLFEIFRERAHHARSAEEEATRLEKAARKAAQINRVQSSSGEAAAATIKPSNKSTSGVSSGGTDRKMSTSSLQIVVPSGKLFGREGTISRIKVDLPRTFPQLAFFNPGGPLHERLRDVLETFCFFRPDCGYVQGMSYLAAMLLLNLDTFDAFAALANIMAADSSSLLQLYKMDGQHNKLMFGLFMDCTWKVLPAIAQHFESIDVLPDMFLLGWWMTLFAKYFPLEIAARVWDRYLLKQGQNHIFRISLGILSACQNILLNSDFAKVLQVCHKLPPSITPEKIFNAIDSIPHIPSNIQSFVQDQRKSGNNSATPAAMRRG